VTDLELTGTAVRLLVGTPCTQTGVTPAYLQSMLALQHRCAQLGWSMHVETRADGLVTRSRNIFASQVVRREEYTHLLMIDADMGFEAAVVERLVGSGHEVVGACVPLREVKWEQVRDALDLLPDLGAQELAAVSHGHAIAFLEAPQQHATSGFLPVRFIGGAMLLVSRDALVRLAQSDQVSRYEQGGSWSDWPVDGWTFFDPLVDPADSNYLSEDYAFCLRWRTAGGTVWADLQSAVSHTGSVRVGGAPDRSLAVWRRLTSARHGN
jgi:hypothetical protein